MLTETWRIWVCGCKGIVHDPDLVEDIEPVRCSRCQQTIREIEVAEAEPEGESDDERFSGEERERAESESEIQAEWEDEDDA